MTTQLQKPPVRLAKRAKSHLHENVEYRLIGKDGREKAMFKDWFLNRAFLKFVRARYNPYRILGEAPMIGAGGVEYTAKVQELKQATLAERILTNLALYGLRIPGITGVWSNRIVIANLVTDAGKAGVASRINGAGSEAAFTYIAVGTGTTAANAADTTLETELAASGLSRAAATASRVTTDVTNDTAQLVLTFTVTGTAAVTESGVLNASSGGVLLCRQVFSAINVVNGDSLQVTWKIDVD